MSVSRQSSSPWFTGCRWHFANGVVFGDVNRHGCGPAGPIAMLQLLSEGLFHHAELFCKEHSIELHLHFTYNHVYTPSSTRVCRELCNKRYEYFRDV